MGRISIQKIYGNIYFNPTGEGHGREGKIREATLFGRKFSLVSSDGVTKRLNRGSLIDFLNAETKKIDRLKDKHLEKGWFFGYFGSSDTDIANVYKALFKEIADKDLKSIDDVAKKNKSAILHMFGTLRDDDKRIDFVNNMDPSLKSNPYFMIAIIKISPTIIEYIFKNYINLEFITIIHQKATWIFNHIDRNVISGIIKTNPDAFEYLNKTFIFKMIAKEFPEELINIPSKYIDRNRVLEIAEINPLAIQYVPSECIDRDCILDIAKKKPLAIKYISSKSIERDCVLEIIRKIPLAVEYIPSECMDRGCILEVAETYPWTLRYISSKCMDRDCVLEVVKKRPLVVRHFSKNIILEIAKINHGEPGYSDKIFILQAIAKKYPEELQSIPSKYMDPNCVLEIAKINHEALKYIPLECIDRDCVLEIAKISEKGAVLIVERFPSFLSVIMENETVEPKLILELLRKNHNIKDKIPRNLDFLLKILKLDEEKFFNENYNKEILIIRKLANEIIEQQPSERFPEFSEDLLKLILSFSNSLPKKVSKGWDAALNKNLDETLNTVEKKILWINTEKCHVSKIFGKDIPTAEIIELITNSEGCKEFKYANFSGLKITGNQLKKLLERCPNIEYFNLLGFGLRGKELRDLYDSKSSFGDITCSEVELCFRITGELYYRQIINEWGIP